MNAREPLTVEERLLAGRLAEWSVGAPSVQIEQRILAQARAAVVSAASMTQGRKRQPWLFGLASAAVLTLAVGVVWRVSEAPPESAVFMESAPVAAPAAASKSVESVESDSLSVADLQTARQAPEVVAPSPAPERSAASVDRIDDVRAPVAQSRQRAAVAPSGTAPAPQAWPASPAQDRSIEPSPPAGRVPDPVPFSVPPPAEPVSMVPPPPPPAPPAPAAPPVVAPASPVVEQAMEAAPSLRSAPGREDSARRDGARAEGAAGASPERREQAFAGQVEEHESTEAGMKNADARFQREVSRIRALLQRGERREAIQQLRRLRQDFPLHTLPDDLQTLIERDSR